MALWFLLSTNNFFFTFLILLYIFLITKQVLILRRDRYFVSFSLSCFWIFFLFSYFKSCLWFSRLAASKASLQLIKLLETDFRFTQWVVKEQKKDTKFRRSFATKLHEVCLIETERDKVRDSLRMLYFYWA